MIVFEPCKVSWYLHIEQQKMRMNGVGICFGIFKTCGVRPNGYGEIHEQHGKDCVVHEFQLAKTKFDRNGERIVKV